MEICRRPTAGPVAGVGREVNMCDKRCVLAAAAAQNLSKRWGIDERGRHGYRIIGSLEAYSGLPISVN